MIHHMYETTCTVAKGSLLVHASVANLIRLSSRFRHLRNFSRRHGRLLTEKRVCLSKEPTRASVAGRTLLSGCFYPPLNFALACDAKHLRRRHGDAESERPQRRLFRVARARVSRAFGGSEHLGAGFIEPWIWLQELKSCQKRRDSSQASFLEPLMAEQQRHVSRVGDGMS